jgi:hypothetical protein
MYYMWFNKAGSWFVVTELFVIKATTDSLGKTGHPKKLEPLKTKCRSILFAI